MATESLVPSGVTTDSSELVHLVARNPQEMAAAQADLAIWLQNKVASMDREISEVSTALAVAKANKWATSALANQVARGNQRKKFYEKTLLAVQLGYTIVPNFPIDVFAIRTNKESPKWQHNESQWTPQVSNEKAQLLPAGTGRYQGETPLVYRGSNDTTDKDGKKKTVNWIETAAFADVEFPVMAARVEVMDATAQAMTAKLFDSIGICPQSRKGDPLIIGRIIEAHRFGAKEVSFLIAWHLDLRTL